MWATTSTGPPGGNGTTIRIARSGKAAEPALIQMPSNSGTRHNRTSTLIMSPPKPAGSLARGRRRRNYGIKRERHRGGRRRRHRANCRRLSNPGRTGPYIRLSRGINLSIKVIARETTTHRFADWDESYCEYQYSYIIN